MASTGRIPLWLIATVGGIAALTVVGLFFLWFIFWCRFFIIELTNKNNSSQLMPLPIVFNTGRGFSWLDYIT